MSSVTNLPNGGRIIKTNCFECHAKCGVLCEVDKAGKLVNVKGNPEDPRSEGRLCSKGLSAKAILYDPDRLRYPLKRVGKRGEGKWKRITWDEALDTIESTLKKIREESGAQAIAYGQGTGRGTNQWSIRMGMGGGAVHHAINPGNICLVPMMYQGFFQFGMFNVFDGCDFDNADCIVFWGSNTMWTEATYTSGQLGRSRDRGAKLIVIDPFFEHPMAAKADHFVGVRPGSDVYLAAAWLRLIMDEGLYDEAFTKKWTNAPMLITKEGAPIVAAQVMEGGSEDAFLVWDKSIGAPTHTRDRAADEDLSFEGTLKLVDGTEVEVTTVWNAQWDRVKEWTPEKASEMTWVPAETIAASARTYANADAACISVFQGLEEQTNCKETLHFINNIIAICGNVERKGTNLSMPFWNQMMPLGGPEAETQLQYRLVNDKARGNIYNVSNPTASWKAIREGDPYKIRAYVTVQGNPLSWCENTKLVRKSLEAIEFLVVMDYYMSPTAELADIVLPSTHWTERDYLADEVCSEWCFGQQKAVEPLYERRSDVWFYRNLGRRLNPENWPWDTDEELFNWQLEQTHAGITWEELKEQWIHKVPENPAREYQKNGFATPTGRLELYSVIIGSMGSDPLPAVVEPKISVYATPEIAKEYPLTAVTGRRYPVYYHSAYRGIPHLREIVPDPQVIFHTSLAKELGIEYGEWVWVESPTGRITMKARPTDGLDPRVCYVPHGWWQGCEKLGLPGYPDDCANANVLTTDQAYNDEYMTPGLRSTMVRIVKKESE
ncbi:MAG: molybdopterin-dependent oxidoreductase [Slackia sp.]|nr:molybdopterin-dependent oxidoreductase [Slackia sp.]